MFKKKLLKNKKRGLITTEATVTECLPNGVCRVKIKDTENFSTCYLSGNMIRNHISLIVDDIVIIEYSIYNFEKCRVVFRK
ncbi:translation initiation factor IF-1 [Candidatus Nasuia deltocephalinicola]|uniref:translation initiation factor IF-1 n=1 Tax=Candidatus Nasuia deltocephalincola TaxID=1160784 RepID=UPI00216B6330|nr:translation initiation factor IF-1 [Candidatus Nasuia deltocephalinicola]